MGNSKIKKAKAIRNGILLTKEIYICMLYLNILNEAK